MPITDNNSSVVGEQMSHNAERTEHIPVIENKVLLEQESKGLSDYVQARPELGPTEMRREMKVEKPRATRRRLSFRYGGLL